MRKDFIFSPEDSTLIDLPDFAFCSNIIDKYIDRPHCLEPFSLHLFCSYWQVDYGKCRNSDRDSDPEEADADENFFRSIGPETREPSDSALRTTSEQPDASLEDTDPLLVSHPPLSTLLQRLLDQIQFDHVVLRSFQLSTALPRLSLTKTNTTIRFRKQSAVISTPVVQFQANPELWYFQVLLLYQPFRNEADLSAGYSTFREAFLQAIQHSRFRGLSAHRANLFMKTYARSLLLEEDSDLPDCSDIMSEIYNYTSDPLQRHTPDSRFVSNLDVVCDDSDDDANYQDEGELACVPNFVDEDFHIQDCARLNQQQTPIFDKIKHTLVEESNGKHPQQLLLFVSGAGGCGKSFLLKLIRDLIPHILD